MKTIKLMLFMGLIFFNTIISDELTITLTVHKNMTEDMSYFELKQQLIKDGVISITSVNHCIYAANDDLRFLYFGNKDNRYFTKKEAEASFRKILGKFKNIKAIAKENETEFFYIKTKRIIT